MQQSPRTPSDSAPKIRMWKALSLLWAIPTQASLPDGTSSLSFRLDEVPCFRIRYIVMVTKSGRGARTIRIYCMGCGTLLYKYLKGGPGHLVKCFTDGIVRDYTQGDLTCPECGQSFARPVTIRGRAANKIIQGKVYVRR